MPTVQPWTATQERWRGRGSAFRVPHAPNEHQIPELLALTHDDDPRVRQLVLKHLLPRRLQRKRNMVWARVFELTCGAHPGVRRDPVHALTDGSIGDTQRVFGRASTPCAGILIRPFGSITRFLNAIPRTERINVN